MPESRYRELLATHCKRKKEKKHVHCKINKGPVQSTEVFFFFQLEKKEKTINGPRSFPSWLFPHMFFFPFFSFLAELCWWSPEALLLEELVGKRSTFPRDECGWKWEGGCKTEQRKLECQSKSRELKSEKKSSRIDGQGRRGGGVKKLRTGLKVQGEDLWYPQREGEKGNEWIEGKNGSYLSGIPGWLLSGKKTRRH